MIQKYLKIVFVFWFLITVWVAGGGAANPNILVNGTRLNPKDTFWQYRWGFQL